MAHEPLDEPEDGEAQAHSDALLRWARELTDEESPFCNVHDLPEDMREQFWRHVSAFEDEPWVTGFEVLRRGGMELTPPEDLDDSQLTAKLWELIRGMARARMFLYHTDHLSDRELYEDLWHGVLREECPDMPLSVDSAWHIDLLGSGSAEDTALYMRYFADAEERRDWAKEWPDDPMPDRETPPYDRDQHLPVRDDPQWMPGGRLGDGDEGSAE